MSVTFAAGPSSVWIRALTVAVSRPPVSIKKAPTVELAVCCAT